MSVSKNAILSHIARESGFDKDDVRLHVDMFLAEIGRELAKSKAVKIKGFGTLAVTDDGMVTFVASPTLVRSANMAEVLDGIAQDVAENLAMRLRPGPAGQTSQTA
jgi:protein-disulfide isomerase-like protein with CxxC motif